MNRRQRGFTLIETLVALGVLALTATAILALISQAARFLASSEERALAAIAVDNVMIEALIDPAQVEIGEEEGEVEVADRAWRFRRGVSETGVAGLFRIDVEILDPQTGRLLGRATTLKTDL